MSIVVRDIVLHLISILHLNCSAHYNLASVYDYAQMKNCFSRAFNLRLDENQYQEFHSPDVKANMQRIGDEKEEKASVFIVNLTNLWDTFNKPRRVVEGFHWSMPSVYPNVMDPHTPENILWCAVTVS